MNKKRITKTYCAFFWRASTGEYWIAIPDLGRITLLNGITKLPDAIDAGQRLFYQYYQNFNRLSEPTSLDVFVKVKVPKEIEAIVKMRIRRKK